MPKNANACVGGDQVPGSRIPLDRADDGQSRAVYCLGRLGFERSKEQLFLALSAAWRVGLKHLGMGTG